MKSNLKLLFIFLTSIVAGVLVAVVATAWTNPTGNPTTGGGILYYSGGNVGIGTASPAGRLHVKGSGDVSGIYVQNDSDSTKAWFVKDTSGNLYIASSNTDYPASRAMYFQINGSSQGNVMAINSSGNVGIGTVTPATKLQIVGGNIQMDNGQGLYFFTAGSSSAYTNIGINGSDVTDTLTFRVGNQDKMVIQSSAGKVGIGTTSPSAKLEVSAVSSLETVRFYGADDNYIARLTASATTGKSFGFLMYAGTNSSDTAFYLADATNGYNRFLVIRGDGNVGLGTPTPSFRFHVAAGTVGFSNDIGSASLTHYLCYSNSSGAVQYSTSCGSSSAYKENIKDLSLSGINTINQLRPREYNFKGENKILAGLVAEEVAPISTLPVMYDEKGKITGLNYDSITAVLVRAVQEQQTEIEKIKTENSELKNQNDELKARIEALELK